MSGTPYEQELGPRIAEVLRRDTDLTDIGHLAVLPGGHSGLTYRLPVGAGRELVVKAVPRGQRSIGRHDMLKQARIMRALASTDVPVPTVVAVDEREPAWFAVDFVHGESIEPTLDDPAIAPSVAAARMLRAAEVLPRLHRVPVEALPSGAEALSPQQELARWSKTMAAVPAELVPGAAELQRRLAASVPDAVEPTLVHGDYRLGNIICRALEPVAVIDWEIWSVGDPRVELGWFLVFADGSNFPGVGRDVPGLPSEAALLSAYTQGGPPPAAMDWFSALGRYKMAAIMGHNLRRHREGRHEDPAQERLPRTIVQLIDSGLDRLGTPRRTMHFALPLRTEQLKVELERFMDEHVLPAEAVYDAQIAANDDPHEQPQIMRDLQKIARERGLWNLFMTHGGLGAGLTNLEYAPLAEVVGRSIIGNEAINCSAPDTGNMEILAMYGTAEQQRQWLHPLLNCEIRSAFAMTEPDVASSDATNITSTIRRDGDDYVLDGRKWYTSGILDPDCKLVVFMGKSNPDGPTYRQQSMVLVPADAPGVEVLRDLPMFGYRDRLGHGEVQFTDVRVPATNMLGEEGDGFAIAQGRLGPGRMHYAMRAIGFAERALDLMCRRAVSRVAFGEPLADRGVVREWIARSRMEIDQIRLLTFRAAWLMDTQGNKAARSDVAAIKVAAMETAHRVVDRAVQTHGAAGVSDDTVLARLYSITRALQIADGPNEVHLRTVARLELQKHAAPA